MQCINSLKLACSIQHFSGIFRDPQGHGTSYLGPARITLGQIFRSGVGVCPYKAIWLPSLKMCKTPRVSYSKSHIGYSRKNTKFESQHHIHVLHDALSCFRLRLGLPVWTLLQYIENHSYACLITHLSRVISGINQCQCMYIRRKFNLDTQHSLDRLSYWVSMQQNLVCVCVCVTPHSLTTSAVLRSQTLILRPWK